MINRELFQVVGHAIVDPKFRDTILGNECSSSGISPDLCEQVKAIFSSEEASGLAKLVDKRLADTFFKGAMYTG